MRNQKVSADNIPAANPINKLRKDMPQVQPGVKPKSAGKQFQTDGGKTALRALFMKQAKQRMK